MRGIPGARAVLSQMRPQRTVFRINLVRQLVFQILQVAQRYTGALAAAVAATQPKAQAARLNTAAQVGPVMARLVFPA